MQRLLTVLLFVLFAGAVQGQGVQRPKLVVGIVVDQMRWDYLYRYYDRYDATIAPAAYAYRIESPALTGQETTNNLKVLGQVTGTLVKDLSSGKWLRTVNYYDSKYRPFKILAIIQGAKL